MMSHRIVRQLGWVLWLLDAAVIVAGIIMFARTPGSNENGAMLGNIAMVTAFFAFPTMGALIIWQRPWNTVGWIFCFIGLGTALDLVQRSLRAAGARQSHRHELHRGVG